MGGCLERYKLYVENREFQRAQAEKDRIDKLIQTYFLNSPPERYRVSGESTHDPYDYRIFK